MDLRGAPAEFCGDVFGQPLGVAACGINIKIFVCFEFIQHIINGDFDAAVCLIHYFCGQLHFINKQKEMLVLLILDDAFHIFA